MKIIADDKMPGLEELIAPFGEVVAVNGRRIDQAVVKTADVLLVRSITSVDAELLSNSRVRFVGTATSGLDHIDQDFLRSRGIELAHARGSNAEAVVDYCLAALASLMDNTVITRVPDSVGIVGVGEVGSRLASRLQRLGIEVRLCDPPLKQRLLRAGHSDLAARFMELQDLSQCSLVSLHVPLVRDGKDRSEALVGEAFLDVLPDDAVLFNTSRGGVVDEAGLLRLAARQRAPVCVFDVWSKEPRVNPALVEYCALATPHIAGYSQWAKLEASRSLARQLRVFSQGGSEPDDNEARLFQDLVERLSTAQAVQGFPCPELWQSLVRALPLDGLSHDFKAAVAAAGQEMSAADFDAFRQQLQQRRQFNEIVADSEDGLQRQFLLAAGFADAVAGNSA